jgi:hypothetical protein
MTEASLGVINQPMALLRKKPLVTIVLPGEGKHTTYNSQNKWTKILSLEMTIFVLKVMVKSGLILKFHVPLQSCFCAVQKNLPRRAELACLVSRYL